MDNPPLQVSCLPPELLVRIFEYLVIHSSPTILLQICHRWADIASSISSLSSRIDFSTPPAPLLQRCINQPIEVILPSSPLVPTSNQLRAAKEVLLLHSIAFVNWFWISRWIIYRRSNPRFRECSLSLWMSLSAFGSTATGPSVLTPSPSGNLS